MPFQLRDKLTWRLTVLRLNINREGGQVNAVSVGENILRVVYACCANHETAWNTTVLWSREMPHLGHADAWRLVYIRLR